MGEKKSSSLSNILHRHVQATNSRYSSPAAMKVTRRDLLLHSILIVVMVNLPYILCYILASSFS
jgi:hypothetical protein